MNTDTCPDCSNHPCDCGLPAAYAPTPRERFRKTLDISTGVSELLADSNASYISWLERELTAVTEQRDEMARAIIRFNSGTCCLPYLVDLALQSLNQAAAKGGSHES